MRVIGVDPSLRKSGVVLLEVRVPLNGSQPSILKVLECAVVESVKGTDIHDIVATLHEQILEFIDEDKVSVCIEVPIFGRNAGVLIQQGFLIGGVSALLDLDGVRPRHIHPMSVKSLLGVPRTPAGEKPSKDPVVAAVRKRVGDPDFLEDETKVDREAICDAIGIALVGAFRGEK